MNHGTQRTLVSLLRERSNEGSGGYTYLDDRFANPRDISWRELDEASRAFAVALLKTCVPGDRALLVLPSTPEFLFAFFGCLYAGVIAVPASEPDRPRDIERLKGLIASAKPAIVIATRALLDAAEWPLPGLAPSEIDLSAASAWSAPEIADQSTAFLQFTSGSTGSPKGVIVSHANILANERMIAAAFEHDSTSTVVGWLPHYHDMGLIGNILHPLFIDARGVLASPAAFLRDPLGWLRTLSSYRGRTGGGPNFAYELCIRRHARLKDKLNIDLSSWSLAFVGAEPVRARTMREFARVFAPYGFDERALFPCYGLAEGTLLVTGSDKGVAPRVWQRPSGAGSTFVGCGKPTAGLDVKIVDTQTLRTCAEGEEGEIFVSGPSICAGYYERPEETRATFGHRLPGSDGAYLRTGDLAIRKGEEIYITGRLRDCIIINGQNYYPQDIEAAAEAVQCGIRAGHCAAFSFESEDAERVGLVCEVSGLTCSPAELCQLIRVAVANSQALSVDAIVLIEPRSLAKTTSGKVERQAMRRAFLEGTLRAVAASSRLETPHVSMRALEDVRIEPRASADLMSAT